ncbi:MFS transporter [Amycolatopsis sp. NPDC059027]|uniref:MFS transporter n=1 Tax=Amycolatopsis sp. NPDC059027 TaxID=3346709 RepID=UPI00366D71D8
MSNTRAAGRREWLGLLVLVLPTLVVAMDMTALFLALPRVSADLGADSTQQLWITDSYGFLVAGFVITMGTLGDRIGRRRLLLIGAAAFAAVSIAAAWSPNPQMLIIMRGLLGIAGATLTPSTLALISSMFRDERQRGKAIAVWATSQFAGGALGPVLAGFLLQYFWWGSVFLIAVPVMVLLLIVGPMVLPEYRAPAPGRLDLASVGLSLVAVLLTVYGLKRLTVEGPHDLAVPLGTIVVGLAVGAVFVRRQLKLETPLLDLRLFRNRPFAAVLVALVLAGVAMAGTGLMVTQYLQSVLGFSPLASAVLFAPMGLAVAVGTMAAPGLTRWLQPSTAIAAGLAVSVLGSVLLILADSVHGLPLVMVGIAVLALGTGPLFALGTGLVVGSVPVERAGSAASMSETGNYFGGSLGLALLGVLGASVYSGRMTDVVAAGVPTVAGETLAGATAVAEQLPPAEAAELLRTAKDAFTSGLNVVGVVAAVLFSALAVLVVKARSTGTATDSRAEIQPAAA